MLVFYNPPIISKWHFGRSMVCKTSKIHELSMLTSIQSLPNFFLLPTLGYVLGRLSLGCAMRVLAKLVSSIGVRSAAWSACHHIIKMVPSSCVCSNFDNFLLQSKIGVNPWARASKLMYFVCIATFLQSCHIVIYMAQFTCCFYYGQRHKITDGSSNHLEV